MKKSLLAALAILSINLSFAQDPFIRKNNWMVGGRVMYSNQTQDVQTYELKQNSFSFAPNVAYFPWDKVALGARISYGTDKTEINNIENKQTDFLFGPYGRYYLLDPTKKLNLYGQLQYGIGSSKQDDDEAESISKYGVEAGLAWFCNPRVALEFFGGYRSVKYESEENRANTLYFGIGFQIHLQTCGDEKPIQAQPSSRSNF